MKQNQTLERYIIHKRFNDELYRPKKKPVEIRRTDTNKCKRGNKCPGHEIDGICNTCGYGRACSNCRKVKQISGNYKDDLYYDQNLVSMGICDECLKKLYPEYCDEIIKRREKDNAKINEGD